VNNTCKLHRDCSNHSWDIVETRPVWIDLQMDIRAKRTAPNHWLLLLLLWSLCTGSQPAVTISHPSDGRLPLLSDRPAVTFPAAEHLRPLAATKLYCLVTEAHRCEQLAQGCYAAFAPRRNYTHDLFIASPMLYSLHHLLLLTTNH